MTALKVIIVLSGLIAVCLGTTCYVCDSIDSSDDCADDYSGGNSAHQVDCDSDIAYTEDGGCSKLKTKATVFGVKATTVSRTCGQSYDDSSCAQGDRQKLKVLTVSTEVWSCSCTGDNCNTAAQTHTSYLVLTSLAAFARLLL